MNYKRIHIRVPLSGKAVLSNSEDGFHFTAQTINISEGGVAITDASQELQPKEYQIAVSTENGQTITLTGLLLRQKDNDAGFKTTNIKNEDLKIIMNMVEEYQSTPEFLEQLTDHDMLQQNFIDDEGNELEVTFDIDP